MNPKQVEAEIRVNARDKGTVPATIESRGSDYVMLIKPEDLKGKVFVGNVIFISYFDKELDLQFVYPDAKVEYGRPAEPFLAAVGFKNDQV